MAELKKQKEKFDWIIIALNKYYKYFLIFLCFIILFGAGFFWLWPKYQEVLQLAGENLPLRQEKLNELTNYYNELQGLKDDLESFQLKNGQNLEKIKKILPPKEELANIFAQLEALIIYRGKFNLKSLSFSPVDSRKNLKTNEQNSEYYMNEEAVNNLDENVADVDEINQPSSVGMIDISISITGGGYLDFKELLGDIEKQMRLMDITSINFNDIYVDPQKDEEASYLITLRAYYTN